VGLDVNLVLGAEILRDGGSLCITYQGKDSCQYWLLFPIKDFYAPEAGFKKPAIVNRSTNVDLYISWNDALIHLKQLKSLASKQEHKEFISKMLVIANENT